MNKNQLTNHMSSEDSIIKTTGIFLVLEDKNHLTNHMSSEDTNIGVLYWIYALLAGFVGTAFSVLISLELSGPGVQFIADSMSMLFKKSSDKNMLVKLVIISLMTYVVMTYVGLNHYFFTYLVVAILLWLVSLPYIVMLLSTKVPKHGHKKTIILMTYM